MDRVLRSLEAYLKLDASLGNSSTSGESEVPTPALPEKGAGNEAGPAEIQVSSKGTS